VGGADSTLEVDVALPAAPSFAGLARLVVAGVAARSALPVDRMEELQLAVDTIVRRSAATDSGGLSIRMRPAEHRLSVRVGPLRPEDNELADLEHVLCGLVDEFAAHDVDGDVWVDLEVGHRSLTPAAGCP
jgi:hypothetical protein